ncbi:hypothetical protein HanXRQr2_Chr11g0520611 [Helianthus annuus]|uniref:Uncharacterized protein n=1 Tax=Helianthus annuus TaxID=4232 RepID=A0A251TFI9_HELAN|nr:hypothetical protein HanXRQr2_Chr11g0520611 [Helianthus annuus]KAJ0512224.1 hypothetical protein HanIR_Chr11g0560731 [Helianthus annuus]KAJ0519655.1 hypothetical protein HanHA89_Chr11g0451041 [Helianthus annuus]KAJ0691443.1 hypothetical protein HanOQP8_Chr11g0428941 [Helianthus annuus]
MPTNPNGALGSLDYMKEQRPDLAVKSRETAPNFGSPDRQKLIDEVTTITQTFHSNSSSKRYDYIFQFDIKPRSYIIEILLIITSLILFQEIKHTQKLVFLASKNMHLSEDWLI